MKIKMEDKAVAEVIGAVILLAMAISVFSVVYMNVLADPGPDPNAFVTIIGNVEGNNLILTHQRGKSLSLDTEISLKSDIINESFCVKDYLDDDSKKDGEWNIGEKVIYDNFSLNKYNIRNYLACDLNVVDKETNSLVFWGIIDLYPEADIGVTINVNPEHPIFGKPVNITINVTNYQMDADAINIEIQYLLPQSLQYINYSASRGCYNNYTGIWNISYLERNSYVSINIIAYYTGVSESAQLAMILDGSGTIDNDEWNLTRNGLSNAVQFNMPHDGSVEFTVIQFASYISGGAQVEVGPVIVTEDNYQTITNQILKIKRMREFTPLAAGIKCASNALKPNSTKYPRQIINIVTDGGPYYNPNSTKDPKKAYTDAEKARNRLVHKILNKEDEIDAVVIDITTENKTWMRDNIVWPRPGDDTWPPAKPGWIRSVNNFIEFSDTINEIFREFFKNSIISNNVKIISVTPKTDPNLENNKKELILKV